MSVGSVGSMNIHVSLVGLVDHHRTLQWPTGWPVPREGDSVDLPDVDHSLAVRVVEWYPEGDGESPEPFVYVVIGKPRPT